MGVKLSSGGIGWLLGLLLFFVCPVARAGDLSPPLTNLRVLPSPVMAFEPVYAVLGFDGCGGWEPAYEVEVHVDGSIITFTHGVHTFCGVSLPPRGVMFRIGAFPAGQYTLVYAPTGPGGVIYPPQTVSLAVLSAPVAVPNSSITALVTLFALILLGALRTSAKDPL